MENRICKNEVNAIKELYNSDCIIEADVIYIVRSGGDKQLATPSELTSIQNKLKELSLMI